MGKIRTFMLPELIQPSELRGVAVVIDQLRASTTMCAALCAGANGIRTFETIDGAREHARHNQSEGPWVFGGERGGVGIPGFDLDNSPRAYSADRVAGRNILFTTTNGTRAIRACAESRPRVDVLVGCLGNVSELAGVIGPPKDEPVALVCAGTHGRVSQEDVLAAGAIADRLMSVGWAAGEDDDSTRIAIKAWRQASAGPGGVEGALLESLGGRNLRALGLSADVAYCARLDAVPAVPRLDGRGVFVSASGDPDAGAHRSGGVRA